MGDRANVVILDSNYPQNGAVYLYTHWGGEGLPVNVEVALKKFPSRWDDASYLARIVFDVMTEGRDGEETGFGISATLCDNEHPLIVLDCGREILFVLNESEDQLKFEICKSPSRFGIRFADVTSKAIMKDGYK